MNLLDLKLTSIKEHFTSIEAFRKGGMVMQEHEYCLYLKTPTCDYSWKARIPPDTVVDLGDLRKRGGQQIMSMLFRRA